MLDILAFSAYEDLIVWMPNLRMTGRRDIANLGKPDLAPGIQPGRERTHTAFLPEMRRVYQSKHTKTRFGEI
ncbi:hypothetical protein CapIbe_010517 [Capra ibex]